VLTPVQLSVPGLYLPPVLKMLVSFSPPQIIHFIACPDCRVNICRPAGAVVISWLSNYRARFVSPAGIEMRKEPFRPTIHFIAGQTAV